MDTRVFPDMIFLSNESRRYYYRDKLDSTAIKNRINPKKKNAKFERQDEIIVVDKV